MKQKKIVIAGGSGFIGQSVIKYFSPENDITVLTRNTHENTNAYDKTLPLKKYPGVRFVIWDGLTLNDWYKELEGSDLLINLCGKTVNCRYTEKNKREIFNSRTNSTKILGLAVQKCVQPPKLWINAASATIYRYAEDHAQDEYNGEFKNDFSVQVCKLWEKTFFDQRTPFTRKVALRMAINLGPGGVMVPYFNLLKFGLGGTQGTGKQMYSWIHIEDTCRMIEWVNMHEELEGVYNCCSPEPVTNKFFMACLRKVKKVRIGLPAPAWLLKIGARIIGTEAELVLKSRWVIPTKILQSGFQFKFPGLEDAFRDIITKRN